MGITKLILRVLPSIGFNESKIPSNNSFCLAIDIISCPLYADDLHANQKKESSIGKFAFLSIDLTSIDCEKTFLTFGGKFPEYSDR